MATQAPSSSHSSPHVLGAMNEEPGRGQPLSHSQTPTKGRELWQAASVPNDDTTAVWPLPLPGRPREPTGATSQAPRDKCPCWSSAPGSHAHCAHSPQLGEPARLTGQAHRGLETQPAGPALQLPTHGQKRMGMETDTHGDTHRHGHIHGNTQRNTCRKPRHGSTRKGTVTRGHTATAA